MLHVHSKPSIVNQTKVPFDHYSMLERKLYGNEVRHSILEFLLFPIVQNIIQHIFLLQLLTNLKVLCLSCLHSCIHFFLSILKEIFAHLFLNACRNFSFMHASAQRSILQSILRKWNFSGDMLFVIDGLGAGSKRSELRSVFRQSCHSLGWQTTHTCIHTHTHMHKDESSLPLSLLLSLSLYPSSLTSTLTHTSLWLHFRQISNCSLGKQASDKFK